MLGFLLFSYSFTASSVMCQEEEKRAVLMLIYLYAIIDTILFMLLQVLLVVTLGPFIIQLTC